MGCLRPPARAARGSAGARPRGASRRWRASGRRRERVTMASSRSDCLTGLVQPGGEALGTRVRSPRRRPADVSRMTFGAPAGRRARSARRAEAVDVGHQRVGQHQVERRPAARGSPQRGAALADGRGRHLPAARISDRMSRLVALSSTTSTGRSRRLSPAERGAPASAARCRSARRNGTGCRAGLALEPDPPVHHLDELRRDGQAEAGAAVAARRRGVGLHERAEDLRCLSWRDADAGVAHREAQAHVVVAALVDARHVDDDLAASVNLMALPTRLRMICRRRPGSPTSASGTSGAMRHAARDPSLGAWRQQLDASSTVSRSGTAHARASAAAPRSSRRRGCR